MSEEEVLPTQERGQPGYTWLPRCHYQYEEKKSRINIMTATTKGQNENSRLLILELESIKN